MVNKKIILIIAILLIFVAVFGTGISAFASDVATETRYADAPMLSTYADEKVSFYRREVAFDNSTFGGCPMYYNISGLTNSCGAIAGAEIVAFYDRHNTELIPGWTPYYESNSNYKAQDSTYIPALIRELYTLMRTNVDGVGVSESDFLNGLTSYINGKGYQVSYQSVKSGNAIDTSQCIEAVECNKVVVLFVSNANIYTISEYSKYDVLSPTNISGAHIMVAYGYLRIKYYNIFGLFRTDTYLYVSTGRSDCPTAYYRVDATTTQSAYMVTVK